MTVAGQRRNPTGLRYPAASPVSVPDQHRDATTPACNGADQCSDVTVVTPAEEPAIEDDTTARLFELRAQCVRNYTWMLLTVLGMVGLSMWMGTGAAVLGVATAITFLAGLWHTLIRSARQPAQAWIPAAQTSKISTPPSSE